MASAIQYRFPFARYPAVRIVLLLIGGIFLAHHLPFDWNQSALVLIGCMMLFLFFEIRYQRGLSPRFYRLATVFYLFSILLFGVFWYSFRQNQQPKHGEVLNMYVWEELLFQGSVYEIKSTSSGKLQIDIVIDSTVFENDLGWSGNYNMRAVLDPFELNPPAPIRLGTILRFSGTIYPLEEKRNPHEFDYKTYLASKNIFVQAGIDSIFSIRQPRSTFSWIAVRKHTLELIEQNFDPSTQSLAKALLIGHKNELERSEKIAFSRAGLSHIMAVSGLHVSFIIAPFWILIPWFWTFKYGKQAGLILLVLLLVFYAGLTGFSASVSRAALTGGLITYGKLFHKLRDSLNLTAVAAIVLLLIDPGELFKIGFQLSFAAVYIILLTSPTVSRFLPPWIRFRWYGKPLMIIIVSLLVQIGLYPLLVYYFGEFSLVGPIANAVVVPVLGFAVPFSLLLLPVSAFFPDAGSFLNIPNEWVFRGLGLFVEFISGFEWSWISAQVNSPLLFAIWIAAILWISSVSIHRLRWKLLSVTLFIMVIQSGINLHKKSQPAPLIVTVFDVGQGDAILVKTPHGKHFLIDAGRWTPTYNSGLYEIIPHLEAGGVQKLDAVFLSHPHADHIGGIVELIEQIPIDTIYNSGYPYHSDLYKTYLERAREKQIPVKSLRAGQIVPMDSSVRIFVFGPDHPPFGSDPNEHSLIIELVYGKTEFLFMGDAGMQQESTLINAFGSLIDTDFLKVGHHGSNTSSSPAFLQIASPQIAVVSVAWSNRFRHPRPEAVRLLRRYSSELYFTSLHKAVVFSSDGSQIKKIEW